MDSRYKHKIGQEVANSAPTPVNPTDDSKEVVNVEYLHGKLAETGGTSNTSAGAFTGVFDVSGGNKYYDDYTSGSVVNLSLSTSKALGATATVRIQGDLTGTIPSTWNFSGSPISTTSDKVNEITLLYVSDFDIRIINRVFDKPVSNDPAVTYMNVTRATDEGGGTLGSPVNSYGGWESFGWATRAINGDNAVAAKGVSGAVQILGFTVDTPGVGANGTVTLSTVDFCIVIKGDNNTLQLLEDGTKVVENIAFDPALDVIGRVTGSTFTIEHNGSTVYTSSKSVTLPLTPVSLLNSNYSTAKIQTATFENTTNTELSTI